MIHLDTEMSILKECAEYIVSKSMEILTKCFERFTEVYRNSPIAQNAENSLYNAQNLAHWSAINSGTRALFVQKHFLEWAYNQARDREYLFVF